MGPGSLGFLPPRTWTVEIHSRHGGPVAICRACGPVARGPHLRTGVLHHLARHARREALPGHLRTCQCGRRGCPWHPRRRPCSGPVALALTCGTNCRAWRLTDACAQCRAAMPHTAPVPEILHTPSEEHPQPGSRPPAPSPPAADPAGENPGQGQTWEALCARCGQTPDVCWWNSCTGEPG